MEDLEKSALASLEPDFSQGGLDEARKAEEVSDGETFPYKSAKSALFEDTDSSPEEPNSASSSTSKKPALKKLKGFKRTLPLVVILLLVVGGLIVSFLAQTMMPFAVVNRIIEEFNTTGVSSVIRSDNLLDLQLSTTSESIGLSDYQRTSLKEQNILSAEYDGSWVLGYRRSNGKYAVVVTTGKKDDEGAATAISDLFRSDAKPEFDKNLPILTAADAMNDINFSTPFTTAAKLWRGGVSGWYDSLAEIASSVHGYERSRWAAALAAGADSVVKSFATTAASALKSANSGVVSTELTSSSGTPLQYDDNGNLIIGEDGNYIDINGESVEPSTVSSSTGAAAETALSHAAMIAKFTAAAKVAKNVACAGVEGLIGLQTVMAAYNRLNGVNVASGFIEGTQVAQYNQISGGYQGGAEPMNQYAEKLTAVDPETGQTAMQSQGLGSLMSGDEVDTTNPSVMTNNTEKIVSYVSEDSSVLSNAVAETGENILNSATGLVDAMTACSYAGGMISIVSATASGVALALAISTGGLSAVIAATFGAVKNIIVKAAIVTAISAFANAAVDKIISYVGDKFMQDAATEWLGPALGDIIASRSNTIMGANAQTGSQTPASAAKVAAYKSAQNVVLAQEAEYQRQTRSPLDVTSRYTFLGSLVYSTIPLATSAKASNILKSLGTLSKNSLTALLPTASAVADTNLVYQAKPGDCPVLESIGIQGDAFCNPLMIEDPSNLYAYNSPIDSDVRLASTDPAVFLAAAEYASVKTPAQAIDWELSQENIKESGNTYVINEDKKHNELKRFIVYCGQRVSNWGLADANITSALKEEDSSTSKSILAMIPIIGDIVSLVDSATEAKNLPWTTGEACVASDDNDYWNGAKGNNRIHQLFVASDRWQENAGLTAKSTTALALEKYYQENPLDTSFEGILARYSGMTKDTVIAYLNYMEVLTYLAHYHPEDRTKLQNLFTPREIIPPTLADLGQKIKNTIKDYIDQKSNKPYILPRFETFATA